MVFLDMVIKSLTLPHQFIYLGRYILTCSLLLASQISFTEDKAFAH